MKYILLFAFLFFAFSTCWSQKKVEPSSSEIFLSLKKLKVVASVLYIAAHPDDENTKLIAYLSKERLLRTGYLSLTRGDGGQNLIGKEQGIELGLIRTQELLAARRLDGGEQFFSRAYDFGFSKSPDETLEKWGKEKILSDVVWMIRTFQPDVIITRFPTTGEGGHGHHTASAILANEAFIDAADSTKFPEQLKYTSVWKAKRILWNTFNFGDNNTTSNDQLKVDVGGYNSLLGKGYGEIAADSRSNHKSQGFGVSASRGQSIEFFKTTGGDAPVKDLMDGVNMNWDRLNHAENIDNEINAIISNFDFQHTENSVSGLVNLYNHISNLPETNWKEIKLKEVKELIAQCSGLWMECFTASPFGVQTDSVAINFSFNNRLGNSVALQAVSLDGFDSTLNSSLEKNKNLNFTKTIFIPQTKPITQPYWLQLPMDENSFNVADQKLIGRADAQPAYVVSCLFKIFNANISYQIPVTYKHTDPVKGELYNPFVVIPPYTLKINPALVIGNKKIKFEKIFTAYKNNQLVGAEKKADDNGLNKNESFVLNKNEVRTISVEKNIPTNLKTDKTEIEYYNDAATSSKLYDLVTINYDHIPTVNYFKPAESKISWVHFQTKGKNIGYIPGAGDKIPEALEQMGYTVTTLTNKELVKDDLKKYDAIITGIRAYNTNEQMPVYYNKLMKYIEDGGNLIVQYNTYNQLSNLSKIFVYDFTISRNRVTDENATVTFLQPDHPVLNFPNKITQDDFKGWIQERSVYDAVKWGKNFTTIFSMNDKGEKPDEGSLIIANYGKGKFVYTALDFFRELPAGVPGAYRLFANIIALNQKADK